MVFPNAAVIMQPKNPENILLFSILINLRIQKLKVRGKSYIFAAVNIKGNLSIIGKKKYSHTPELDSWLKQEISDENAITKHGQTVD